MVSYGDIDFLLTGDAGTEVEEELMAKYDLNAEVLKVSHHGSNTGTSDAFLAEFQPMHAVLSYGVDNPYGHPHSDILKRLFLSGIHSWSTPEGDIEMWTHGNDLKIDQGVINEDPMQNDPDPKLLPTPTTPTDNGRLEIASKDSSGETVGIKNRGSNNVDMTG
jgi:competence protein ComEC